MVKKKLKLYSWNLRNWVQLLFFTSTILIGIQFFLFVGQVQSQDPVTISRPAGVEGFLPIGALMGWKRFLVTGEWDMVHPAAMVILGFAVLTAFLFRKSFCGWFCPVGTFSEWMWKLDQKYFGKNYRINKWIDYPLRSLKYLLLGFFAWAVFGMSAFAIERFLESPYYQLSDVKMLHFFTQMSTVTFMSLLVLTILSLIYRNFWCRYLCPYGALLGIFSVLSPTRIKRDTEACTDCGVCSKACPYHLPVDKKVTIRSAECNGCMDCTLACPVKETLSLETTAGFTKFRFTPRRLSVVVMGIFMVCYILARTTGVWDTKLTIQDYQKFIPQVNSGRFSHPG